MSDAETTPRPVRLLVFAASMRAGSLNGRLAELAARELEAAGAQVDRGTMREFDCPSFDGDVEQRDGLPPGATALSERLLAADGFVIASPEYNFAMPGVLKNAIDWASRRRPQPFSHRHAFLLSASPSMVGGNRGLWSLRVPLEHLGARVAPDMFSLAQARDGFTDAGELANETLGERLRDTLRGWVDHVEATVHYPRAKARWIEFLGEQPGSAIDRAE